MKNIILSLLILVFYFSISSCSSLSGVTVMDNVKKNHASDIATDYRAAVNNASPEKLTPNVPYETQITSTDAVSDIEDNFTNYKLFTLNVSKNDVFNIEIKSICDCLGFDKKIMIPKVTFVTRSGVKLESQLISASIEPPAGLTPLHLLANWELKGTEDGVVYLIVAASNRNLDNVVKQLDFGSSISGVRFTGTTYVKYFPHGKLEILFTTN